MEEVAKTSTPPLPRFPVKRDSLGGKVCRAMAFSQGLCLPCERFTDHPG